MNSSAIALSEWAGKALYFPAVVFHVFWFAKGYTAIFSASHDRLATIVEDRAHFHLALIVAFSVAWYIGRPRPSAWVHLRDVSPGVFLFRALVGLHSARIALFLVWLGVGTVLLHATNIPDPAAAAVAGTTILFLLAVLTLDRARRIDNPGHYIETDDELPRSGSALTLLQARERLGHILLVAGL